MSLQFGRVCPCASLHFRRRSLTLAFEDGLREQYRIRDPERGLKQSSHLNPLTWSFELTINDGVLERPK